MMKLTWLALLALIQGLFTVQHVNGANILIFHHTASYSQIVTTWQLAESLSSRGHQVSYIAPHKWKDPNTNISVFVPEKMAKAVLDFMDAEFDINVRIQNQMPLMVDFCLEWAYNVCEALISSQEFENWFEKNQNIDLLIIDNCFPECAIALAQKLGAKYMIFNTMPPFGYEYDAHGLVPESSSVPDMDIRPSKLPMGFIDRVNNALMLLRWRFKHYLYSISIDEYLRTALKMPDMPYIGDLVANTRLIFSISDPITDYPIAVPPNVINVAGIHCKESDKPLPQEMEDFIAANGTETDGFVYISLGSMIISSKMPQPIKQVFFEAIKSFPKLKFLWKWNGEFDKNIPENVFLAKWFPQLDVLGHPKIRAFVSQTGRPSTHEALFNGVPMIVFPILGDQDYNAQRLEQTAGAIRLEIGSVTLDEFKEAIRKSVYDPSVKAKVTKQQKAFRDRPMTPVQTATWWVQYVLRTDDTSHLRAAGINQNWFVRRQIDVWAFFSIVIFVVVITVVTVIFKMHRALVGPKMKKE